VAQRAVVCDVKVTNLGLVGLRVTELLQVDSDCVLPAELAAGAHFNCSATRSVMWRPNTACVAA
jgi:hypothetical protein